jgi:hypothetical protein
MSTKNVTPIRTGTRGAQATGRLVDAGLIEIRSGNARNKVRTAQSIVQVVIAATRRPPAFRSAGLWSRPAL